VANHPCPHRHGRLIIACHERRVWPWTRSIQRSLKHSLRNTIPAMHTVALQNKNRVRLHSVSALADRRGRYDARHGRAGGGLTVQPLYLSPVSRANRKAPRRLLLRTPQIRRSLTPVERARHAWKFRLLRWFPIDLLASRRLRRWVHCHGWSRFEVAAPLEPTPTAPLGVVQPARLAVESHSAFASCAAPKSRTRTMIKRDMPYLSCENWIMHKCFRALRKWADPAPIVPDKVALA
jgi:hypothetical protein